MTNFPSKDQLIELRYSHDRIFGFRSSRTHENCRDFEAKVTRLCQPMLDLIDLQARQIEAMQTLLTTVSTQTERAEIPCGGKHRYYSCMADDAICPKCGSPEDGPGRDLVVQRPTRLAELSKAVLKIVTEMEQK